MNRSGTEFRFQNSGVNTVSKRVDEFENMSDEELRQYVYGKKELNS